ncbi:hypothetical protein ACIQNK_11230 [Streptomyces sp. NPDC091273]|uniref:hypothetical protein n=1 Tax=Streptomyces sp. NPDC091273 TaxID=3365982 RepID=UPI0038271476
MSRETGENSDEGGEPPDDGSREAESVENPWVTKPKPKPDNPEAFGDRMRALTPGGEAPATEPNAANATKAEVGTSEDEQERARRLEEALRLAAVARSGFGPVKGRPAPDKSPEQPGATQQDLSHGRGQGPEQGGGLEKGLGD